MKETPWIVILKELQVLIAVSCRLPCNLKIELQNLKIIIQYPEEIEVQECKKIEYKEINAQEYKEINVKEHKEINVQEYKEINVQEYKEINEEYNDEVFISDDEQKNKDLNEVLTKTEEEFVNIPLHQNFPDSGIINNLVAVNAPKVICLILCYTLEDTNHCKILTFYI